MVAAAFVELPRGLKIGPLRGVDVDLRAAAGSDLSFGFREQETADAAALLAGFDGEPVNVEGAGSQRVLAKADLTGDGFFLFSKDKFASCGGAFFELVLQQVDGGFDFAIAEEAGRGDEGANFWAVGAFGL